MLSTSRREAAAATPDVSRGSSPTIVREFGTASGTKGTKDDSDHSIPLDGALYGEHALSLALSVARRTNGGLHLVHVTPASVVDSAGMRETILVEWDRVAQHAYLQFLAAKLQADIKVQMTFDEWSCAVPKAIGSESRAKHVDILVMSTHGQGAPKKP